MSLKNSTVPLAFVNAYSGVFYALLMVASVAWGVYYSLDWMFYADAPIMHYMAWRILEGAAPYRDVLEMNMPGTYLLHIACLKLFGSTDFAFRLFDLFFSVLSAAAIAAYGWRQSKSYALAAGLLYIAYHFSWGAKSMGERDFLMTPFLLFAAYALRVYLEDPQKTRAILAFGLLMGCACWIKPTAAVFVAFSMIAVLISAAAPVQKMAALAYSGLGLVIPTLGINLWLYQTGALSAFYEMLFNFLSFYSSSQPISWQHKFIFLFVHAYCFCFAAFLLFKRSGVLGPDKTILVIGLLYGAVHFYAQGKGLWYHLYPMRAFWCLYFSIVIPQLQCRPWENVFVQGLLLAIALNFSPLQALFRDNLLRYEHGFSATYLSDVAQNANDALKSVPSSIRTPYLTANPRQAVQFFSLPDGELWNVAYREGWIAPSRHIYAFPIYMASTSPYMAKLNDELFADLSRLRPLVIIVAADSWPQKDGAIYNAIDTQTSWKSFFLDYYHLSNDTGYYRVYYRIK